MNALESYMTARFKEKPWIFFSMITAKQKVGNSFEDDLKELKEKQMICFRKGVNGELIQMINLEKWELLPQKNNQNPNVTEPSR